MSEPAAPAAPATPAEPAEAPPPNAAARVEDETEHGGKIEKGSSNVTINGRAAARLGDEHSCPLVVNKKKHVGGPIVNASFSVTINGLGAARVKDELFCLGPEEEEKEEEEEHKLAGEYKKRDDDKKYKLMLIERTTGPLSLVHNEGKLGPINATADLGKFEGKAEVGAEFDPEKHEGFAGAEVGIGGAAAQGQLKGETWQLPIPFTDYGVSVEGEVTGTLLSAEIKGGVGIKYDEEDGFRLFAGEKLAALVGEGVKLSLVFRHRPHPPEKEPETDRIKTGSPDVTIGI